MRAGLSSLGMILIATALADADTSIPQSGLDKNSIHSAYTEGDFETVIAQIDIFTRAIPAYSKEDSIFIAKHLAVIYTANPVTREKGKGYMFRLLELLPSAKIVDMFVSDEIDRIFERIREEYVIRRRALGKDEPTRSESDSAVTAQLAAGTTSRTSAPKSAPVRAADSLARTPVSPAAGKPAHRSRTAYWVAGGTALVAASGALAYFLMSDPPASKETVYDVPH